LEEKTRRNSWLICSRAEKTVESLAV